MSSKLVRDKIPEIIRQKGEKPVTYIADDQEYWRALRDKLEEEVGEFLESEEMEELADILEVVEAIGTFCQVVRVKLEKLRRAKKKQRGGFEKRIILTSK